MVCPLLVLDYPPLFRSHPFVWNGLSSSETLQLLRSDRRQIDRQVRVRPRSRRRVGRGRSVRSLSLAGAARLRRCGACQ